MFYVDGTTVLTMKPNAVPWTPSRRAIDTYESVYMGHSIYADTRRLTRLSVTQMKNLLPLA